MCCNVGFGHNKAKTHPHTKYGIRMIHVLNVYSYPHIHVIVLAAAASEPFKNILIVLTDTDCDALHTMRKSFDVEELRFKFRKSEHGEINHKIISVCV